MKILILGGSGMLGHRLWINLGRFHETWATVRGQASVIPDVPEFPRENIYSNVDALTFDDINRVLALVQPNVVINCIGLIKQATQVNDPLSSILANALLPHRLALICKTAKIRMIHFSTDCVFSGKKGNYKEEDISDAVDLYGRTKFLGEVNYPHAITLRTSIIGREIKSKLGLIEWFLAQSGSIKGFTKAIYSGFTTDEMSRIVLKYILPNENLCGIYHISSDPISKFDLLSLVKKEFNKQINIIPYDQFECDRSLDSSLFREITGYQPPSWEEMICELASTTSFYDSLGRR